MRDSHVSVAVDDSIRVMVLLHRVWKKHPVNVDFLGFYAASENQYSPLVHGLIGGGRVDPLVTVSKQPHPRCYFSLRC